MVVDTLKKQKTITRITLFLSIFLSLYLLSSVAFGQERSNILPGKSMGGIELQSSCSSLIEQKQKEALKFVIQDMVCSDEGKLIALESNSGGYLYFGPFTVGGANAFQIITALGPRFTVSFDAEYPQSIAYYVSYDEAGIAFRIVYIDKGDINLLSPRSLLQAIRIFIPGKRTGL